MNLVRFIKSILYFESTTRSIIFKPSWSCLNSSYVLEGIGWDYIMMPIIRATQQLRTSAWTKTRNLQISRLVPSSRSIQGNMFTSSWGWNNIVCEYRWMRSIRTVWQTKSFFTIVSKTILAIWCWWWRTWMSKWQWPEVLTESSINFILLLMIRQYLANFWRRFHAVNTDNNHFHEACSKPQR